MNGLGRLQRQFQSYLLNRGVAMNEEIVGTPQASAEERLEIYAEGYRLRLLEALSNDFPALHTLLGDAQFDQCGRAYIDYHPSTHPSLRWFGQHLARFLRETSPYAGQPVLSEMAAFEWAQGEVFDAEDSPAVALEEMAALAPETWPIMHLVPHPSVRRLDLACNVPVLWRAIDEERDPPQPECAEHATAWLLWRRDLRTYWRSLESDERWAVDAFIGGHSFGELCEGLCDWVEEEQAALHAAGLLKRWISDGLIARIELREE